MDGGKVKCLNVMAGSMIGMDIAGISALIPVPVRELLLDIALPRLTMMIIGGTNIGSKMTILRGKKYDIVESR